MGRGLMDQAERRTHARESLAPGHARLAARLRTGSPLRVLNTSPDGMLVESPARLLPGRHVNLVVECGSAQEQAPWVVVHSRVGSIRGSADLRYRAGLRRTSGSNYPPPDKLRWPGHELPATIAVESPESPAGVRQLKAAEVGTGFGRQDRT